MLALRVSTSHKVRMFLTHLAHLWKRMESDVGLIEMLPDVILVVVLCRIERREGLERGDNRTGKDLGLCQLPDFGLRSASFGFIGVEDRRPILRADIVVLTIELGRVMGVKKDVEQPIVRDLSRVVPDADGLGVPRVTLANAAIICGLFRPACEAARDGMDSFELPECRLGGPETS